MARRSGIEWTEATWNPVTGCTKVSPGCKRCYAERMSKRLRAMGQRNYAAGFRLTLQPHMLERPLHWKRPQTIFVNSMSDLFHPEVPRDYIRQVFSVMERAPWHRFQVLTKRARRLARLSRFLPWPPQIWIGVSVESERYLDRVDWLRDVPGQVRFLSLEPLLGPVPSLDLTGIHWVIAGGESGPRARPMERTWVAEIRDQCARDAVPFFFKQWGGPRRKAAGRALDGREWNQMPSPHRGSPPATQRAASETRQLS